MIKGDYSIILSPGDGVKGNQARYHRGVIRSILVTLMFFFSLVGPGQQFLAQGSAAADPASDLTTAIIRVAKENIPVAVHVEVTERQEVVNPLSPLQSDPFFKRFFGIPDMPPKFKREVKGLGSGILMDEKGHILTNYHVAGGAAKIDVQLSDGRRFPAELIGGDPKTDLAVIRIEAKEPLPHATFGDSDKVEVGSWVVAIGQPRGLSESVTQGIISAKHRRGISDPSSYQDFLQTDAAINPGNSGGPLLNLKGEVIGVNAAIVSQSGGFEGIGFAIPSNMALHIANTLIKYGKVTRGWLGVSIQDLTPELVKSLNLQNDKGVHIADAVKGGPADKAELKAGDVIIAYDGRDITDAGSLRNNAANTAIGREVRVTVIRQGKKLDKTVKIGSMEEYEKIMASFAKERLGVEVEAVPSREAGKYGLQPNLGVMITSLDAQGPLQTAGFEVEDIILGIDNEPVFGVESFLTLVGSLKPKQKIAVTALDHNSGNTGVVQIVTR